jgi:TRAP-type C4-dicarboxylate transport system permease small subunit
MEKIQKDDVEMALEEFDELSDDLSDFKWYDIPVLGIFWLLIIVVALQFVSRYIFNDSIAWTEEIARYLLIIMGFVGGITCVRKGKHIFLEFFYRYLPMPLIKRMIIFVEMIVTAFFTYAGFLCIELAERTAQNMVFIPLPKSTIYYTVMLACFLMALFALINIYRFSKLSAEEVYTDRLGVIE